MKRLCILLLVIMATGCASVNKQNFHTDTDTDGTVTLYSDPVQQPDGEWVALIKSHTVNTQRDIITGRNLSTAMPFQAKNNADAHLDMEEGVDEEGNVIWKAKMGQIGSIDGGDVSTAIDATGDLVTKVGDAVVDVTTVGATDVIKSLTNGGN